MLSSFFFVEQAWFIPLSAISYGVSNCFFWVTQRSMFLEHIDPMSSGRKFGNLQIFVFIIVQFSILLGGYLLQQQGFSMVFFSSVAVSILGISLFYLGEKTPQLPKSLTTAPALSFNKIASFSDSHGSRRNFLIDGPFLFLEGFYWTISLFLLSNESFMNLGIIVILLALAFALSFYLIKNKIDQLENNKVYKLAILLYSISWILRGLTPKISNIYWLGIIILIITFFTSFFRLSYNKRFFDIAHQTQRHAYLFLKSYYSQLSIFITFGLLSLVLSAEIQTEGVVNIIYYCSAPLSLLYLSYRTSS